MANFNIFIPSQITLGTDDADVFTYVGVPPFTYVQGAGGNDQFIGAGSANGIMDGQDGDDLFNFGAIFEGNHVLGGNGNDFMFAGLAAGGDNFMSGGAGDDWLGIGSPFDGNVLDGGDGNDWLGATASFASVFGGAGDDTITVVGADNSGFGGSGNDSLFGVGGLVTLDGGDGNDWVGVSADLSNLLGGAGNDTIAASGNNNLLDGGIGNDTLIFGPHGLGTVVFSPGYESDTVEGFDPSSDVVSMQQFVTTFSELQTHMTQSGADTVITFGSDVLTLEDTLISALGPGNFLLVSI